MKIVAGGGAIADYPCPDCGGAMWDNIEKKESGEYKANAPDYVCCDRDGCGYAEWPEGIIAWAEEWDYR